MFRSMKLKIHPLFSTKSLNSLQAIRKIFSWLQMTTRAFMDSEAHTLSTFSISIKSTPVARFIICQKNYRCSHEIVSTCAHIIRHNEHRYEKKMQSGKPTGNPVKHKVLTPSRTETTILWIMKKWHNSRPIQKQHICPFHCGRS